MDAARLKRARRRLLGYFLGSGVIMALLFLILAGFIIHFAGVSPTSYIATLVLVAGVFAGGTYAIVMAVWLAIHIAKRFMSPQPIMEIED